MNRVILSGRLTKEAVIRTTSEGLSIGRSTVAVDEGYGEKKRTSFINLVAFGKTAESMERYSFKGQRVVIDGKLQTGSYEKDGHKVFTTDVVIDRIEFTDWKESGETKKTEPEQLGFSALEEDVPF